MRQAPLRFLGPGLALAGALALVTAVTRLPFASQMLYSYDSANYAFALRDYYNVAHHQPHPPGYPLYVALAKVVDLLVNEPNRSLVLLSILAACLAVAWTFWLGAAMFGTVTGLVAGLVLMTSAGFWGYSEVAYPYTILAACSVGLALVCWQMLRGRPLLAAVSGVVVGVVAGIRWDAAAFLAPLWLLALWRVSWRWRLSAAAGLGAVVAAWAIPMVQLSGGWAMYAAALRAQSSYVVGTFSPLAAGGLVLRLNFQTFLTYLRLGLGVALLPLLLALGRMFSPWRLGTDLRARFLLLWLSPPIAVYVLVHIGDPGYVLSVAPAACLLVGATLVELAEETLGVVRLLAARWPGLALPAASPAAVSSGLAILLVTPIVVWNGNVFLRAPGPARLGEIRLIGQTLRGQIEYVRSAFQPERTVVLSHDRFRQAQFYLRGYDVRLLFDEYQPDYQTTRSRLEVNGNIEQVVVLDEQIEVTGEPARLRRVIVGEHPAIAVWVIDTRGAAAVEYGYRHVAVVS